MKLILLLSALFFMSSAFSQLQEEKDIERPNRWRTGGGVGISLGNHTTAISVSPMLGYMLTEKLETGVKAGYNYNKYDSYTANYFSGGVYGNYTVIPELFIQSEYEYFTGKQKSSSTHTTFHENALWIGGGYQGRGRVALRVGIMYNLLYDEDSSVFSNAFRPFGGVSIAF